MFEHKYYDFIVNGLDPSTFTVARFTGSEGISTLYRFKIMLLSTKPLTIEQLDSIVNAPARLEFLGKAAQPEVTIHGIVSRFEYLQQREQLAKSFFFYRAFLVPKVWRLTRNQSSKIFLGKKTDAILEEVLQDATLNKKTDFEINIKTPETPWDYVCMFNESPFDFISHRMERNGIYYYFEQGEEGEVMHIVDDMNVHTATPVDAEAPLRASFSVASKSQPGTVHAFYMRQDAMPQKVLVRDYYYDKAKLDLQREETVDENGVGQVYCYGEHLRSQDEAKTLAKIRKEELLCRRRTYTGASNVWSMRSGYLFTLTGHPNSEFNTSYLVTEVQHQGQQVGYLHGLFGITMSSVANEMVYSNTITCIESQTQYRPQRKTCKNRFHGLLSAKVDGDGDAGKPYIDENGRYKLIMPFDTSGRENGTASSPIRMVHPYAGKDVTLHFPLLKGSEALVAFIDGDPDRPIITGAAHNSEAPSIITSSNSYLNAMQTPSGQVFWISEKEGDQHILAGTTEKQGQLKIETPSSGGDDTSSDSGGDSKGKFASKTSFSGNEYKLMLGNYGRLIVGNKVDSLIGTNTKLTLAPDYNMAFGPKYDVRFRAGDKDTRKASTGVAAAFTPMDIKYEGNDSFKLGDGSSFNAKPSQTVLGQEKGTMFGGADPTLETTLESVKKTYKTGMGIAAALSLGLSLGGAYLVNQKKVGSSSTGDNLIDNLGFMAVGALPCTIASLAMNKVLRGLHTTAKNMIEKQLLVGGMVQCNKNGVTIQANTNAAGLSSAKVKIATIDNSLMSGTAQEEASIVLAQNGDSITLQRGLDPTSALCKIGITKKNITLFTSITNITGMMILDEKSLELRVDDSKSSLEMSATANKLSLGDSNYLQQDTNGIKQLVGNNEIALTKQNLQLKMGTNKVAITSVGVQTNGNKVDLTGNMINIG